MKRDILVVLPSQPAGALQMVCRAAIAACQAAPKPNDLLRPLSLSPMCRLLSQLVQKPAGTADTSAAEANAAPAARVNGRMEGEHSQNFHSKTRENSVCTGTSCFCSREDVTAPHVPSKRCIPWHGRDRVGTEVRQQSRDPVKRPRFQHSSSVAFAASTVCSGLS